jgi:hypothetical protein
MDQAEALILDQVPLAARARIAPTLRTAYAAAQAIINDEPILNVPSALDNRGRIIQWAVDYGFQKLIETGGWQYDFKWRPFEKPTGRYLEIRAPYLVLTISQVADPTQQPRDVKFRENKRLNNQGWLKGMQPEDEKRVAGLPHALILHGHQAPNFAHLAMPRAEHANKFLYFSANLMAMPHIVTSEPPSMEETDIEAVMTLKEEIDKWRRDNVGE